MKDRVRGTTRATILARPARGVITSALLFSTGAAWAAGATAAHQLAVLAAVVTAVLQARGPSRSSL